MALATTHVSYTQLAEYEACPAMYKFKRIDKIPATTGPAAVKGSIVHSTIAKYIDHLQRQNLQSDITVIGDFLDQELNEKGSGLTDDDRAEIREIIDRFAGSYIFDPDRILAVETKFAHGLPDGTTFVGFIDMLEAAEDDPDVVVINDWKTDMVIRSQADVNRDLQLQTYAWAASLIFEDATEFRCRLRFVRYGFDRQVTYHRDDIPAIEERLLERIQQIKADNRYNPKPGAACAWCPYVNICPALQSCTGPVVCATPEQAQKLAGELAILERQVKDRKEALKAWTAVNGPVKAGGLLWGHFTRSGWEVTDIREYTSRLLALERDPYETLRVDARALSKILSDETVKAELEPVLRPTMSTAFTSRKAAGGGDGE